MCVPRPAAPAISSAAVTTLPPLSPPKRHTSWALLRYVWLDGVERKYVEEVGSMNIMFKVDGEIYTAPTVGTVLPGITRMSCIELLKKWGYKVHEERFTIDFIMDAAKTGKLEEVFGTGTAAVISPVGGLTYEGDSEVINNGEIGEVTQKLYDTLTGIQ